MDIEFKRASSVGDVSAEGTFRALVAVTGNVDRAGDVIIPGAFTKTLDDWQATKRAIPLVYSHNWKDPMSHLGAVTKAEETDEGLVVEASLDLDHPPAMRVFRAMQAKSLTEFSIGYIAQAFKYGERDGERIRELHEIELLEVGPTIAGANPDTRLLGIKAIDKLDIVDMLAERLALRLQESKIRESDDSRHAVVSAWTKRIDALKESAR